MKYAFAKPDANMFAVKSQPSAAPSFSVRMSTIEMKSQSAGIVRMFEIIKLLMISV